MKKGSDGIDGDIGRKRTGFLLLRLFFAQFWLLQFYGKVCDADSRTISWGNLSAWSRRTADWFTQLTPMPGWLVGPYTHAVPFCELAIGLLLLAGLQTRRALIFSALLLISLDAGLMLQFKHDIVAMNSIHFLGILLAIAWEKYNCWAVDDYLQMEPRFK